jgi:hypothetical protein
VVNGKLAKFGAVIGVFCAVTATNKHNATMQMNLFIFEMLYMNIQQLHQYTKQNINVNIDAYSDPNDSTTQLESEGEFKILTTRSKKHQQNITEAIRTAIQWRKIST